MPGFPVLHCLPELAQTHIHWVSDAIRPSHPLSPASPLAHNLTQHERLFSFLISQLFASGGQSIGASASALVLPMNIQGWSSLGLTGLISLLSEGLSRVLQHYNLKASILRRSAFSMVPLSHSYMTTGKTIALTIWTFVGKVMSLLFNTLSRFVIAFLTISKCLLISWLKLLSTVIWEPKKIKSVTVSTFSSSIWHEVMGCHDLKFL